MVVFRFYCLDAAAHILHGADLDASDLHAAIQLAYAACREHLAPLCGSKSGRAETGSTSPNRTDGPHSGAAMRSMRSGASWCAGRPGLVTDRACHRSFDATAVNCRWL